MHSDTNAESDMSLSSRSFLHRVRCSIVKDIGPFFRRCNTRQQQTFFNVLNVHVFDIGSICIHGNELLRKFTLYQKYRTESHVETDVRHIWKVDNRIIRWDFWSDSNWLGRFFKETIICGQWWRSRQFLACKGRVEYVPRVHLIAAHQQSPRVHEQYERIRTIQRTNHLHFDNQWHHFGK